LRINITQRRDCSNHCCLGKEMCYITCLSVCSSIYSLCKTHALYFIDNCGISVFTTNFTHYLTSDTIFGETFIEPKTRVLILCTISSKTFLILGRNERVIFINVHRYWCKLQVKFVSSSYMKMRLTASEILISIHFLNI
jgi:hypothetical protein